jgi:hypothetical protein
MVSKKSIIKALKEAGFEKQKSILDSMESQNRSYVIQVTSRSKQGWKYIFYNPKTNERIEFERYWMTFIDSNVNHSIKLNKNNELSIDSIITNFIRN